MKRYYQEQIFKSPIYPAQIVFIKTNDEKTVKEKHNIEFNNHSIYAHTITQIVELEKYNERRYYLILDVKTPLNRMGVGCLSHECFHLSNMIFDFIGAIPTFENDEPQAYFIQYLMDEGLKFFFNYK